MNAKALMLVVFLLAACSGQPVGSPTEPVMVDEVADLSPTEAVDPTPTLDPFPNPELRVVGEEEIIYDWSSDHCRAEDIPDLPARAFRDASGQVQLIISHTEPMRMIGPDLNTLEVDCTVLSSSTHDADPALFTDNEWIAAPYTEDGMTVYALVHNEYQGNTHSGQCPSLDYFQCWYNAVTLSVSRDGGNSYQRAAGPPEHFVAGLPIQYMPDGGVYGIFSPSNIIKGQDGFYYSFIKMQAFRTQTQSVCLMRTGDLSDANSWRFWDGEAFEGRFADPYAEEVGSAAQFICDPIDREAIGAQMLDSVTFNTFLNRYVLVGISADHLDGREVWGIYYSFSHDLIDWSPRQLLLEVPLPWTVTDPGNNVSVLYPALLDPASNSRNFETTGQTAFLYFTRNNHGHASLDRDLVRLQVEFLTGE